MDIAEFFQGREIDGNTVYGASIYTERGSEGITMGAMDVLYTFGFQYENPDEPYAMEGFVNSPGAVAGLEFYKALYDCCTPPGSSNGYMSEGIDAFRSGQVAMQMNFAFTWPGFETDANVGGGKTGYFVNPAGPSGASFAQLGGQGISVVSYSDNQDAALEYIKWFAQPEVQARWWRARRLLGPQGGARWTPASPSSQPYAQTFLDSMAIVKDFWAEPSLRHAAAGHAEAVPRLRRGRPGHRAGGAGRPGRATGPRSSRTTASSEPPAAPGAGRGRRPAPTPIPPRGPPP